VNDNQHTLMLDGQIYDMLGLPQVARDTLISLQFVEVRLQQLRGEMAVSQTAHVAYARSLKSELAQTPECALSTTLSL